MTTITSAIQVANVLIFPQGNDSASIVASFQLQYKKRSLDDVYSSSSDDMILPFYSVTMD